MKSFKTVIMEVVETVEVVDDDDVVYDDNAADAMDPAPAYPAAPACLAAADNAVDDDAGMAGDQDDAMDVADEDEILMMEAMEPFESVTFKVTKLAKMSVGLGGDRRRDERGAQG